MNGSIVVSFLAGAVVGAAAVWKYSQKKWEKISEEEIESVRQSYRKKYGAAKKKVDKEKLFEQEKEERKAERVNYSKKVTELKYVSNEEDTKVRQEPYIIKEDVFDEYEDYDTISMIFEKGKRILTEDETEKELDPEETFGQEVLDYIFNINEEDIVYVRDEVLKIDYEVLIK